MGRPRGSLTKPEVEATPRALRAEAEARFYATFGFRWDPFWTARVGAIGPTVSRAIRQSARERRLRSALDRLRSAALHAMRVAELEPSLKVLDSGDTMTDELAAVVVRLVAKLPRDLVMPESPWAQRRVQSLRAAIATHAPAALEKKLGRRLTPRDLAVIGILANVRPTVRKKGKRLESVQHVLEREANAYARMRQRNNNHDP